MFAPDIEMFEVLGADRVYVPRAEDLSEAQADWPGERVPKPGNAHRPTGTERELMLRGNIRRDLVSLDQLLADIEENASTKKRFASVFLPLAGHGPWSDMKPGLSLIETGRDIFLMQDRWVGEILNKLQELGIADDTVIVITSDHGLRTRSEFPLLKPGLLNEISFHVPMLIYAPNALSEQVSLDYVTSHIDITPSILSLLGVDSSSILQVGSPIWELGLESRRTYLLANDYFGVDGYFEKGQYRMRQDMTDIEAVGDRLYVDYAPFTLRLLTGEDDDAIQTNIDLLKSLQREIREYARSTQPK